MAEVLENIENQINARPGELNLQYLIEDTKSFVSCLGMGRCTESEAKLIVGMLEGRGDIYEKDGFYFPGSHV
jgi:hypothetical protein